MKITLLIIVFLAVVIFLTIWLTKKNSGSASVPADSVLSNIDTQSKVGGPCSYDSIFGQCKITAITSDNMVKFNFIPDASVTDTARENILNRENSEKMENFNLNQGNSPKIGDEIRCQADFITSGTCTPIIFKSY